MRAVLLSILLLGACAKSEEAPAGNEQAVIDKANADVIAAQAESEESSK